MKSNGILVKETYNQQNKSVSQQKQELSQMEKAANKFEESAKAQEEAQGITLSQEDMALYSSKYVLRRFRILFCLHSAIDMLTQL